MESYDARRLGLDLPLVDERVVAARRAGFGVPLIGDLGLIDPDVLIQIDGVQIDSGIHDGNDDAGAAIRNAPGLFGVDVRRRRTAALAGVVEVPLLIQQRIVGHRGNGQVVVRLGIENARLRLVGRQCLRNAHAARQVHLVQPGHQGQGTTQSRSRHHSGASRRSRRPLEAHQDVRRAVLAGINGEAIEIEEGGRTGAEQGAVFQCFQRERLLDGPVRSLFLSVAWWKHGGGILVGVRGNTRQRDRHRPDARSTARRLG